MNHIHQQKNKNKYITANHHGSQSSKSENRDLYIFTLQPIIMEANHPIASSVFTYINDYIKFSVGNLNNYAYDVFEL